MAENERSWVAIEEPRTYVERFLIVDDSNLSALRDRLSLGWLSLGESAEDLGLCPRVIIEPAIDDRCTGNHGRARDRSLLRLDVVRAHNEEADCGDVENTVHESSSALLCRAPRLTRGHAAPQHIGLPVK